MIDPSIRLWRLGASMFGIFGALALALAAVAGRFVAPLLFETSPHDPMVFAAVILALLAVAIAASTIPARRATRVDPAQALRAE